MHIFWQATHLSFPVLQVSDAGTVTVKAGLLAALASTLPVAVLGVAAMGMGALLWRYGGTQELMCGTGTYRP